MRQDNLEGRLQQHESWKYTLRVMEDETIFFKTKLAHILSNDFDKNHLGHLEIFQHRFLIMDEQVELLRHELRELQEVMQHSKQSNIHPEKITVLSEVLTAKIEKLQDSFDTLASDFRMYLRKSFPHL
jgi:hypothetical protein